VEQLTIDLDAGLAEELPEPGALTLTAEQQEAVRRRSEPILLSAAAGSGKTSVLVERFVQAVREDGLAPAAVLAITFTERAAGELRSRVRARLLELGDREAARDTETAFIGTFHGFCARLLRAHPLPAGLDPEFEILDAGQSARLRERAFEDSLVEFLAGGDAGAVDLLAAYGVDIVRQMIEQVHGELRSRGERRPRLPKPAAGPEAGQTEREAIVAVDLLDRLLGLFGDRYEHLKEQRGSVDFDDLELIAGELLAANHGLRDSWAERFELLMVDEFQDTNPRQMAILASLERGENLFTVGDELQSIYGFRHADVSLFRARRSRLQTSGGALALTGNFRSHSDVLEAVNAAFAPRFERFAGLVHGRAEEALRDLGAQQQGEPLVELLLTSKSGWDENERVSAAIADGLPDAARWRQAEARLLAQRVAELVEAGHATPGEIVVLLRASGEIEVFERALQLRGLRTLATVGTFWGRQQIGDLHSYLRALANPRDEEALYSVLASPLLGISRDGLAVLASAVREQRRGLWETALSGVAAERLAERDRRLLEEFCPWFERERAEAPRLGISQMLERAIVRSGYEAHVLGLDWPERRLANVRKLLRLARSFEAQEGRDLRGFADHVERLKQADAVEPEAPVEGVEPDTVRLMTIHAAKGLEFPVVAVADLGRKPPSRSSNLLAEGGRVGLRLRRPGEGEGEKALDFERLRAERWAREREEEDRVLYVAMTRACDRLLLSGTVEFSSWPKPSEVPPPVNWLGPVLCAKLPELGQEGPGVHVLPIGEAGRVSMRVAFSDPSGFGAVLLEAPPQAPPAAEQDTAAREVSEPIAPAPAVSGPALPATLSYTSLTLLERCGYRYYLERVLRMPEERAAAGASRGEGLEARARGTLVHRLMETHDFAAPGLPDERRVEAAAVELGMQTGPADREEIAAVIGEALRSPLAARIAAARSRRREHPFAFSLGEETPLITGVLDLLCEETDGTALVVDYKSDRLSAEEDPETLVARDYAVQRLLYALAVLRQGALVVEVVHWFLARPQTPAVARYTLAERPTLEEELAKRLAGDWTEPYAVSPRPHRGLCLTCPGRGGMCSWSEEETMREDPGEPFAPIQ
jgi:ATP-dependent exoDNAse (exonuclease V) beta subunit